MPVEMWNNWILQTPPLQYTQANITCLVTKVSVKVTYIHEEEWNIRR